MDVPGEGRTGLRALARAGLATKGLVYLLVGALATWAALGDGGTVAGAEGALSEAAQVPLGGRILVWVACGGLVAYGLWKLAQAALDVDGDGRDWKGLFTRFGYAVSGLAHFALAAAAASIANGGGADESAPGTELWGLPLGHVLVGIAGLVVIGVGIGQLVAAWKASFMRKLETSRMTVQEMHTAKNLGRLGAAARGVVFGIVGAGLVSAAANVDPDRARDVGGALRDLAAQQPYLLAIVAIGLAAYGMYCLTEARFRAVRMAGARHG